MYFVTIFYPRSSLFIKGKRTVELFLGAVKSLGLSFLKCLKVSVKSQNYLMQLNLCNTLFLFCPSFTEFDRSTN